MSTDIVFVGLARNCAPFVPGFMRLMQDLRSRGLSIDAVVGENGSTDGTRAEFESGGIRVIDTSFMESIPRRLERMARGREAVTNAVRGQDARTFCVIDLDNTLKHPPKADALAAALAELDTGEYFAVSAQSRPWYYDLLAYEDEHLSFAGLDQRIAAAQSARNPLAYYALFRDEIYPAQRRLTSDLPIPCISAFNGLCMYAASVLRSASYLSGNDFERCEHVALNRSIHRATNKRMMVLPALQVAMPAEHGPQTAVQFMLSRGRKMLRRLTNSAIGG